MKKLILLACLLTALTAHAQVYTEFAAGFSNTGSPAANTSLGFDFHNAIVQADMVVLTKKDQPVYLGMRGGYNFIKGNITIQPFVGRYIELYTLEKYDAYKNGWRYMFGLKAYYKQVFIQAQISHINVISIGITQKF